MRILLVSLFLLINVGSVFAKQELKAWQKKALIDVKAEIQVEDAAFKSSQMNQIWVSMVNNGNTGRRDGFAQTICMTLNEFGGDAEKGKLKSVYLYDPITYDNKLNKYGSGSEIGMAVCR